MSKKQELFFVLGVAEQHSRVAKSGTYTARDCFVIGVFETEEAAVKIVTEGQWDVPYMAVERTVLSAQGNRKLLRWYSVDDGKAEACNAPDDMRGFLSLTF